MNIAIATAGRFHVLDLARELRAVGHDVKLYSYVPRARARRFGLPEECHVSLLPFVFPVIAWERQMPRVLPAMRERLVNIMLNAAVVARLQPCDVFICMSGIYLEAARYAKRRYGAAVWLERASRHILSQHKILAAIPGAERPSPLAIRRELEGYAIADRVVVPSQHVKESFRCDDITYSKLFYNPFGVDLAMFPPCRDETSGRQPFSLLFVGTWCLRKGCDLLIEAIKRVSDVRLTHVGPIGDLDFPAGDDRFVHFDAVPQPELARFYAAAATFVLASREEGLSYVLAQALASGLPLICTDRTGGADLAHTPALGARITVVPHDDVDALASAIVSRRNRWHAADDLPTLSESDRRELSWAAYAHRYSNELLAGVSPRRPAAIVSTGPLRAA